jgi:hypothetical protein
MSGVSGVSGVDLSCTITKQLKTNVGSQIDP